MIQSLSKFFFFLTPPSSPSFFLSTNIIQTTVSEQIFFIFSLDMKDGKRRHQRQHRQTDIFFSSSKRRGDHIAKTIMSIYIIIIQMNNSLLTSLKDEVRSGRRVKAIISYASFFREKLSFRLCSLLRFSNTNLLPL